MSPEAGDLYMWGWNEIGQLGLPCPALFNTELHHSVYTEVTPKSLHLLPHLVDVLCNEDDNAEVLVVGVSCGTRHSALLTGE